MTPGAQVARVIGSASGMPTQSDAALSSALMAALHGWELGRDDVFGDDWVLMVEGGVAVHVSTGRKVERGQVHEALQRIAAEPRVTEVVLATTRTAHLTLPINVGGKPLHVQKVR